jgi:hypothetical protein
LNGTPKTAYPSEAQARAAANIAWAESRVELTSYLCEICNRWHNGKPFAGEQFE